MKELILKVIIPSLLIATTINPVIVSAKSERDGKAKSVMINRHYS